MFKHKLGIFNTFDSGASVNTASFFPFLNNSKWFNFTNS